MPEYTYRWKEDGVEHEAILHSPHYWPMRKIMLLWHIHSIANARKALLDWLFPYEIHKSNPRATSGSAVTFTSSRERSSTPRPIDSLKVNMWRIRKNASLGLFCSRSLEAKDCGFHEPLTDFHELANFANHSKVNEMVSGWMEQTSGFDECQCHTSTAFSTCHLHAGMQLLDCSHSTVVYRSRFSFLAKWLPRQSDGGGFLGNGEHV